MSGPSPFSSAFSNSTIGNIRYNTSQYGSPLPIIYGVGRVSINLLEFFAFLSGGKGGKGGATTSAKKNTKYSAYVAFAICQGPASFTAVPALGSGYNDVYSNGGQTPFNDINLGLNGYAGNDGQAPDVNFVNYPDPNQPVLGYSGTCYITGTPIQMGNSPVLPDISFEITGVGSGQVPAMPNPKDTLPNTIVVDLLTNARYGAEFPSANLDSAGTLTDWGNFCQAFGLGMSFVMDRQQAASAWLDEICKLTISAPFWSGALLKIVPYGTAAQTGYGVTWTPNLTPIYAVTNSDFIPWDSTGSGQSRGGGTDPVQVMRNDPAKITNWLGLEFLDVTNAYNPAPVIAINQALIDQFGLHSQPTMQAHWFSNGTSAQTSCSLQLNRFIGVRNTYKFKLGWRFALLEPMDIISLTDANQPFLTNKLVRITKVKENENMELEFEAEDLPGVNTSAQPAIAVQNGGGPGLDIYAIPPNANPPAMFEPSEGVTGGILELFLIASGGANWGGAEVFVSVDGGTNYGYVGTVYSGSQQGVSTATLPSYSGANPDTVNTLSVDLTESNGTLVSTSASGASSYVTLIYVGGELLAYETATLTAVNKYNLTTLYRGLYGTSHGAHGSGAQFAYIGQKFNAPGLFIYKYSSNLIGMTIRVKLCSFNSFGQQLQDLSSVTAVYSYTLTGNGAIAPTSVGIDSPGQPITSTPILNFTAGDVINFPANFAGSTVMAGTTATLSTGFTVAVNGSSVGTMTFAAAGSTATFSTTAFSLSFGDVLSITAVRNDATLANITGVLVGSG